MGLAARLVKSRFVRATTLLAGATAISQVVAFAAIPILSRIYTPFDFGAFAVFQAFAATVLVVSSLRYEFAIPLPRSDAQAFSLLLLALAINGVTALLCVGFVIGLRHPIAELSNSPPLADALVCLPFFIFGAGTYKALNYWSVRKGDFRVLSQTKLVQGLSNVAAQLVGGYWGLGVLGLAIAQLLGFSAGTLRLARQVPRLPPLASIRAMRPRMRVLARLHRDFPRFDVPAALVDVISVQLPNFMLPFLFAPSIAGNYLLAERLLSAPLSLMAQSVGQVLYSSSQSGAVGLLKLATRIVVGLGMVVAPPAALLFVFGADLFDIALGESWQDAGIFTSWLVLGLAVQCTYSAISVALLATGGQRINMMIHSIMLALRGAAILYGYVNDSALVAIVAFSIVSAIGYAAAIAATLSHLRARAASELLRG